MPIIKMPTGVGLGQRSLSNQQPKIGKPHNESYLTLVQDSEIVNVEKPLFFSHKKAEFIPIAIIDMEGIPLMSLGSVRVIQNVVFPVDYINFIDHFVTNALATAMHRFF